MPYLVCGENAFGQVQCEAANLDHPTRWRECEELIAASWSQVMLRRSPHSRDGDHLYCQGLPPGVHPSVPSSSDKLACQWERGRSDPSILSEVTWDLGKAHFLGHDSFQAIHNTQNGRVYSIEHLVSPRKLGDDAECRERRTGGVTQEAFVKVEMNLHGGLVAVHKPEDSTQFEYRYYPTLTSLLDSTPTSSTRPYHHILTLPSPSLQTQPPSQLISSPTTDHFSLLLDRSRTVLTYSSSKDNRFAQLGIPPSVTLADHTWVHVDSLNGLYIQSLKGAYAITKDGVVYLLSTGEMVEFRKQGSAVEQATCIECLATGSGWAVAVARNDEGQVWLCSDGKAPGFGTRDTKGHFEEFTSPLLQGKTIKNIISTRSTCYIQIH